MVIILATSFLAGILAILSPCILPIAPVLLLSAWQQHRWGPVALVAGLSITFTLLGFILAATGTFIGLSSHGLHVFFSALLVLLGLTLLSSRIERFWLRVLSPLVARLNVLSGHSSLEGLGGQFILGLILGGAWLPCIGPTLGLAINLANQRQNLGEAIAIMFIYSLGASLPLIVLSYLSRELWGGHKSWAYFARKGKKALGVVLIIMGALLLTGWINRLEVFMLEHSPSWILRLTALY
ncbi:MAG: cytochrome c biogenesis CcdA family protein [Alphaproteobacteria bacterium]